MEENLSSAQNHIQQLQIIERKIQDKIAEVEYELMTKEKELASSEKLIEVCIEFNFPIILLTSHIFSK